MTRRHLRVSHLTVMQTARFVGISHSAVSQRVTSGSLPFVEVCGINMIAVDDVRRLWRERLRFRTRKPPFTGIDT